MSLSIKSNNNAPAARYLEVRINEANRTFSLIETNKKPNSALVTLETIKRVFAGSLAFVPAAGDKRTQEDALQSLKEKANAIQQGYTEKASRFWVARTFKGKEREKIQHLNRTIQNKIIEGDTNLTAILAQQDLGEIAIGFLDDKSQVILRSVNKQTYASISNGKASQLRLAKEYGYEGNSPAEAAIYLSDLTEEITMIMRSATILHPGEEYRELQVDTYLYVKVPQRRLPFVENFCGIHAFSLFHRNNGKVDLERTMRCLKCSYWKQAARERGVIYGMHKLIRSIAIQDERPENRRSNKRLATILAEHYKFPVLSDGSLTRWKRYNRDPDPAPVVAEAAAHEAAPAEDIMYDVD
jgi:hypothetical protein